MKELTIQDKIQILKDAIKYLKECRCIGMCSAIARSIGDNTHCTIYFNSEVMYNYPDFTHDNYLKFYRFNKTVKHYAHCVYWDESDWKKSSCTRRIIFLRYLILKLRIQQFKQWYMTLR